MLSQTIQDALNKQIKVEGDSSQIYLAMASWAEVQGFEGISTFMFAQSEEERMHMLKLVKYINQRGGQAKISATVEPVLDLSSYKVLFKQLLQHEIKVSESINDLVGIALDERDYATHNFLQWYVAEQIEEEANARYILDKINLIGDDKGGLYLFDNEMKNFTSPIATGK
ncbi:ferritin [Flavobacterium gossypii]|jgi:Ferritin-like protein|uniref:Ferritin n=2 Tax=Flavobacterium TaxID=237 RepID=A0A495MD62_9FLAO|nr:MULTISPECIES: ferritin [Flavobacterium]MBA9074147.1 ferritin [Flavobacterium gossypii]RKS23348.1 ferritin [Flavobacterium endophyticum]WDO11701.1 ferritin [Flavobacterium sp. WW92]